MRAVGETYGWFLVISRLAETKVFDIAGKNSFEAAEDADLYTAFTYLSSKNAIIKAENAS